MTAQTCKCKHSIKSHAYGRLAELEGVKESGCAYTFCYCRYETFTPDDGQMVEPLVTFQDARGVVPQRRSTDERPETVIARMRGRLQCPKCGQEGGAEWMTNHYNARSGICETIYFYGEPDVREQLS